MFMVYFRRCSVWKGSQKIQGWQFSKSLLVYQTSLFHTFQSTSRPKACFRLHKGKNSVPDVAVTDLAIFLKLADSCFTVYEACTSTPYLDQEAGCLSCTTAEDNIHCLVFCSDARLILRENKRQIVYFLSSGQHQRRALGFDLTVPLFGAVYDATDVHVYAAEWNLHNDMVCQLGVNLTFKIDKCFDLDTNFYAGELRTENCGRPTPVFPFPLPVRDYMFQKIKEDHAKLKCRGASNLALSLGSYRWAAVSKNQSDSETSADDEFDEDEGIGSDDSEEQKDDDNIDSDEEQEAKDDAERNSGVTEARAQERIEAVKAWVEVTAMATVTTADWVDEIRS